MKRQGGFTLVELMVVTAIIGILVAVAVAGLSTRDALPADEARAASHKLREASRRAIALGAIRADVFQAEGITERTRVRITDETGRRSIVFEVVVEEPLPSDTYFWVERSRHYIDDGVELFGFDDSAAVDPGATTVTPFGGDETIQCYPNGSCDPKTLFFRNAGNGEQETRVVQMPCNGTPLVFAGW